MKSKFICLDFETANNERNSACAIGLAVVKNMEIIEQKSFFIKPPGNYFIFTHIHNITLNTVKLKPTFAEIWPELLYFFTDVKFIAAHNVPFDKSVLLACCNHYNIKPPQMKFKCSCKLSRKRLSLPGYSLDSVCNFLGIELDHHNPLSDAIACAKIMIKLLPN